MAARFDATDALSAVEAQNAAAGWVLCRPSKKK